jgi:hypothetical protein
VPLAEMLIGLIGEEAALLDERAAVSPLQTPMQQIENADLEMWEHHIESQIESDTKGWRLIVKHSSWLDGGRVFSSSASCRLRTDAESLASRIRFIYEPAIASRGEIRAMKNGSMAKTGSC